MIKNRRRFFEWPPAQFDGEFVWEFLKDCWPRETIDPHDFDAVVEIGGRFLVFETKDCGVPVSAGQQRTLNHLLTDPRFTVIFLYGKHPAAIKSFRILNGQGCRNFPRADAELVKTHVRMWADLADKGKLMPLSNEGPHLVIPFNSASRFHWWNGGQSVADTMRELGAEFDCFSCGHSERDHHFDYCAKCECKRLEKEQP